jgi:hypothetical protein
VFLTPTEHDLDQHLSDRWADTLQEEATMRTSAQVLTVVLLLSFAVPCFAKEAGKTQASSPAQTAQSQHTGESQSKLTNQGQKDSHRL